MTVFKSKITHLKLLNEVLILYLKSEMIETLNCMIFVAAKKYNLTNCSKFCLKSSSFKATQ